MASAVPLKQDTGELSEFLTGDFLPIANGGTGAVSAGAALTALGAEATANKGAASGYAGLDGSSKVAIANLPTGTTSTTVAIGNDSRISGAVQGAKTGAVTTTDATPNVALTNISTTTGSANTVDGFIIARNTSTGDSAVWKISGLWNNAAGTASAVGTPTVTQLFASAGASTWTANVTVSAANIRFRVTGQAATNIDWSLDGRLVSVS